MAKEYKVGEKYYLPVEVTCKKDNSCMFPIEFLFSDGDDCYTETMLNKPDLLLTAEDIATVINTERDDALEELKARNAELEALLKEVTATRDEAIRQNNALVEENDKLGTERDQRNKDILAMKKDRDNLLAENEKLKAELKKWYAGYVSQSDYAELSKAYTDKCAELEAFKAEHDKYVMDLEEARDGAVDESLERKNRVTTMEEVIVALVEKIRRLEGDD